VNHTRQFDLSGRIVRYPLGNVLRDLTYDAADRISGFTHLLATDGTPQIALDQSFDYDENSRLTNITTAASTWSIAYDPNGNRASVSLNGSPSTYTTEATSNRLTSITNPVRSFGYDNAGNTTVDSANYIATYGLNGAIASITTAGVTGSYDYDADRRRVRKVTSTGETVIFVYDLEGQLLGEYDRTGKALREYVWLDNIPVAMFMPDLGNASGPPLIYYIHADHLNAPRIVVDQNGAKRWRWLAEPFGTTAPETNPDGLGSFTQNLRFPGQYADAESGLWYNYFRYYAAEGGAYRQSDPIGLAGGSRSTYAYVENNPLSEVDPNGLFRLPTNGRYTPFRPRWRFPNPSQPRPAHDQGNPWMDAAGYFNDEAQFVCLRWKCEGSDMCFPDAYDRRGRSRRAIDFIPAQTDPDNAPKGCVCDDPRFIPKGVPSLWDEKDWADLYGKWRNRPR
jgi:RHS repeat-associated protein